MADDPDEEESDHGNDLVGAMHALQQAAIQMAQAAAAQVQAAQAIQAAHAAPPHLELHQHSMSVHLLLCQATN
jgi:hypothetical protein